MDSERQNDPSPEPSETRSEANNDRGWKVEQRFLDHGPSFELAVFLDKSLIVALDGFVSDINARLDDSGALSASCLGVFGSWGSGKTSVVKAIIDRVDVPSDRKVYFVPSHLSGDPQDLQALLAISVMETIWRADSAESGIVEDLLCGMGLDSQMLPDGMTENINVLRRLARLIELYQDRPGLVELVLERLLASRRTLVVVDDLDRCSRDLIAQMLKLSVFWAESTNTTFLLVGAEEHLREAAAMNALEVGGESYSGQALEKYIHRSFTVEVEWARESSYYRVTSLLGSLQLAEADELARYVDQSYTSDSPLCWLALPHLRVLDEQVSVTPRSFKRRLDRFLDYYYQLRASAAPLPVHQAALAAHFDEWGREIVRLRAPDISQFNSVVELLGAADHPAQFTALYFGLFGTELRVPAEVALFLAHSAPAGAHPAPAGAGVVSHSQVSLDPAIYKDLRLRREREALAKEIQEIRDLSKKLEDSGQLEGVPPLIDSMIAAVARYLDSFGDLPLDLAGTIGNQALLAERLKLKEAAFSLHDFALRADPTHPNVAQNFLEYLIEEELQEVSSVAETVVGIAKMLLFDALGHKPSRTIWMVAYLSLKSPDLWLGAMESILRVSSSERQVGAVQLAGRYSSQLREGPLVDRLSDLLRTLSTLQRAEVLRTFADGQPSTPVGASVAADVYVFLMQEETRLDLSRTERAVIRNNFAATLDGSGINDSTSHCFWLWYEAYSLRDPDQIKISGAFSRFLRTVVQNPELADAVMRGELLPLESDLYPRRLDLPRSFLSSGQWWRDMLYHGA